MKYSPEQMILAAHVRALALDFRRMKRNAAHDKWHAENPGKSREMDEFAKELNESTPLRVSILEATAELERVVDVMLTPPNPAQS